MSFRLRLFQTGLISALLLVGIFYIANVRAAELPQRSLQLSDNQINSSSTYILGFSIPASETLGSIKLQICANDPLFGDPCTMPSGFDISAAVLSAQTGETGFSIDTVDTNNNTLVLTRSASIASAGAVSYTLDGVTNPSATGTYYGRLQTFASTDASGTENDHGGLAFSIDETIQISATVPPYLLFCSGVTISGSNCGSASGSYINFGNFTSNATSSASTELLAATNADSGYAISVTGPTMTSGNNIISAITSSDVSRPSTSQFGLNLVANTSPSVGADPSVAGNAAPATGYNVSNRYQFISGDTLASVAAADEPKKFTVSYIANIPNDQASGVYVTTLTYVCLANF